MGRGCVGNSTARRVVFVCDFEVFTRPNLHLALKKWEMEGEPGVPWLGV